MPSQGFEPRFLRLRYFQVARTADGVLLPLPWELGGMATLTDVRLPLGQFREYKPKYLCIVFLPRVCQKETKNSKEGYLFFFEPVVVFFFFEEPEPHPAMSNTSFLSAN